MTGMTRRGALSVIAMLLALLMPTADAAEVTFEKSRLSIESSGGNHAFRVELAVTPEQMAQGLMFRKSLAPDAGMLFVHRKPVRQTMWMKNTFIPLDMLFIGADGRISQIVERTVPLSTRTIGSRRRVRAVLELKGGTVDRLGIRRGDRVVHELLE